jgi:hypothetical protein
VANLRLHPLLLELEYHDPELYNPSLL